MAGFGNILGLIYYITKLNVIGLYGLVLGSSATKRAYLKSDQGRGWTTFIEAISVTGELLNPAIIFKGKDLQAQLFLKEFKSIANWHYVCSDNGWTDDDIGVRWLKDVYLPQTIPLLSDESDARLLILDGHKSHPSVSTSLIARFIALQNHWGWVK